VEAKLVDWDGRAGDWLGLAVGIVAFGIVAHSWVTDRVSIRITGAIAIALRRGDALFIPYVLVLGGFSLALAGFYAWRLLSDRD
jgi:hypothetical protein